MPYGLRLLFATGMALIILWRSLPGALAFLLPGSVRQRAEPHDERPPNEDPEPIRTTAPALEALGFERLGVRTEHPLLGHPSLSYDWVHRAEKTYASLYLVDKRTRRLYFLTPYDGGASVLTADHKRPGADLDGYYLAGGLPNATPDQLWAAHKRQLAAMEEERSRQLVAEVVALVADCGNELQAAAPAVHAQPGYGADPFWPYNNQYAPYTAPMGPADPVAGGQSGELYSRDGLRGANQFQNYLDDLQGVGGPGRNLSDRSNIGMPYYRSAVDPSYMTERMGPRQYQPVRRSLQRQIGGQDRADGPGGGGLRAAAVLRCCHRPCHLGQLT